MDNGLGTKEYSVADLWVILSDIGEFTILINKEDEYRLRRALINKKSKINDRLKQAGLPPARDQLEFEIKEVPEEPDKVYLKATLKVMEMISVFEMVLPSPVKQEH